MNTLPQDDPFTILLHKKIMNKTGSAKRRAKKYYVDQYRKSGIIPKALFLAGRESWKVASAAAVNVFWMSRS